MLLVLFLITLENKPIIIIIIIIIELDKMTGSVHTYIINSSCYIKRFLYIIFLSFNKEFFSFLFFIHILVIGILRYLYSINAHNFKRPHRKLYVNSNKTWEIDIILSLLRTVYFNYCHNNGKKKT